MISSYNNIINNIAVQIIGFLFLLPIIPLELSLPCVFFVTIVISFIIITSIVTRHDNKFTGKRIATRKELFFSFLINLIAFILCSMVIRLISLFLTDISIINYFIYIFIYFFLVKNIVICTPGFLFINLCYDSNNFIEKIKILIRNICHVSIVYGFVFKSKFNVDDKIITPFLEFILLLYIINIILYIFVKKDMSLLDRLLRQHVNKNEHRGTRHQI